MTHAFITIQGLSKRYDMGGIAIHALDGLTTHIRKNSFTVVMGPSGSGKSTLLHLLGGLDRPTAGKIELTGQRLDEMDENQLARFRRHSVGFIFQSFNLIYSLTALENVGFPLQFSGVSPKERLQRSMELLRRVGLSDRAHHHPGELSGGQQQRVAIARALINDPMIILADEPTGNLDSSSGIGIMQLLSDLHKSGRTILVVTHDSRALRFATDRIYLLDGHEVNENEYREASLN